MNSLKKRFAEIYGEGEGIRVFSSAGRINLIGEHIDYCGGMVLPAALSLRCVVVARKRSDGIIRISATTTDKTAELDVGRLAEYKKLEFGSYQAGVAYVMQQEGYIIKGCDLLFDVSIPFGSGLSSSAAIEVATAFVLSTFSRETGGKSGCNSELAVLSQRAENEYVCVNCGIMDQFASAMGKKDHAIYLNCATLEYEYIPLNLQNYVMIIANSNKKRMLQESKYNERRQECEQALKLFQTINEDISCLAEITPSFFEENKSVLSGKILDRAEHIVYECERVKQSVLALSSGNIEKFGRLLNESHHSLRDKYEVTGFELDTLTELSRSFDGCIGSRMTGAGFGGCTVSIVHKDAIGEFLSYVGKQYKSLTNLTATFYDTTIEDGVFEIT